jgi:hypothetical protein
LILSYRLPQVAASYRADILQYIRDPSRHMPRHIAIFIVLSLILFGARRRLAEISNLDVAASSTAAMSGMPVNTLREGDKQIPIVARLRLEERAQLSDIQNLYIYPP